jgi:hypothetical protein
MRLFRVSRGDIVDPFPTTVPGIRRISCLPAYFVSFLMPPFIVGHTILIGTIVGRFLGVLLGCRDH